MAELELSQKYFFKFISPVTRVIKYPFRAARNLAFTGRAPVNKPELGAPVLFSTDLDGTLISRKAKFRLVDSQTKRQMQAFVKSGGADKKAKLMFNTSSGHWVGQMAQKQSGIDDIIISSCNGTYITVPGRAMPIVDKPVPRPAVDLLEKICEAYYPKDYRTSLCGTGRNFYAKKGGVRVRLFQAKNFVRGYNGVKVKTGLVPYKGHLNSAYLVRWVPGFDSKSTKGESIMNWFSANAHLSRNTRYSIKTARKTAAKEQLMTTLKATQQIMRGDFSFIEDVAERAAFKSDFFAKTGISEADLNYLSSTLDVNLGDFGVEFNVKGYNKGRAVKEVQAYYARQGMPIANDHMFAVGDGVSDIPQFLAMDSVNNVFVFNPKKPSDLKAIQAYCASLVAKENALREKLLQDKERVEQYAGLIKKAEARMLQRDKEETASVPLAERTLTDAPTLAEVTRAMEMAEKVAIAKKLDPTHTVKALNIPSVQPKVSLDGKITMKDGAPKRNRNAIIGDVLDTLQETIKNIEEINKERAKYVSFEKEGRKALGKAWKKEEDQVKNMYGRSRATGTFVRTI